MAEASIFCGGISPKADQESLKEFFESQFGTVLECKLIMDKQTGRHKGYGFITFQNPEIAERVRQASTLSFMGKTMNVGSAFRKDPRSGGNYPNPQISQHYGYPPQSYNQSQQSAYASGYYFGNQNYYQGHPQYQQFGYPNQPVYSFPQQYQQQGSWSQASTPGQQATNYQNLDFSYQNSQQLHQESYQQPNHQ
eukprot:TRINITY_DN5800_c0_g1_i1.p1 TRINITY_DN5800_c0_g1~~TRINITY_DN5800_c0_g1_i1.p1  ORF type:complete len:194 (+),score=35.59 TRINITY_DN5800_c0_g1_i1:67-648(+)